MSGNRGSPFLMGYSDIYLAAITPGSAACSVRRMPLQETDSNAIFLGVRAWALQGFGLVDETHGILATNSAFAQMHLLAARPHVELWSCQEGWALPLVTSGSTSAAASREQHATSPILRLVRLLMPSPSPRRLDYSNTTRLAARQTYRSIRHPQRSHSGTRSRGAPQAAGR